MYGRVVALDAVAGKAFLRCGELLFAGFDAERMT